MKKFLLFFVILIFSSLGANAYTSVKYMAGAPVSVSYGGSPYRSFAYYNNMPIHHTNPNMNRMQYPPMRIGGRYTYGTPAYNRMYYPPYYYPRYNNDPQNQPNNGQMANTSKTVNRSADVSRLSKNYNIQPAKKYTRGNVTYYN